MNPPEQTPEEKAEAFLRLHGGSCSVPHSSPMHRAFYALAKSGKVTITSGSLPGHVNVYAKNFKPKYQKPE